MSFEMLDEYEHNNTIELSEKIVKWLDENVPKSYKYSHPNLCVNVLTIAIFRIGFIFFKDDIEMQKNFIENINETLKYSFKVNNERE